ncbi:hypothetical protein L596_027223 [Steinernema carpocapsae]|uniref:protein-tyrosine-phosphatase n=1 Tax=Steinernema carpocapsae TaxID=34508 RepID=A0A4U5M3N6_STECR|nr:hypothetical protein L596_027223 [Steinernema carpocapsae]
MCESILNFNLPSFCSPWKSIPEPATPATPQYRLPAMPLDQSQIQSTAFRSISAHTLANLIDTHSHEEFATKYCLVDCRYPYEYHGGHIKHAKNLFDPDEVRKLFYPANEEDAAKMRQKIPIFYCEFSQKRGPQMGLKLREVDRKRNEGCYPRVDFPEIYLLDRGYSNFYAQCGSPVLCQPMEYVKMLDKRFRASLRCFSFHRSRSNLRSPTDDDPRRNLKRKRTNGSPTDCADGHIDTATTPVSRAKVSSRDFKKSKSARRLFIGP